MARAKPWYHSRTLWLVVAFVALSIGEWAQQTWLPEAPPPEWVSAASRVMLVALSESAAMTIEPRAG